MTSPASPMASRSFLAPLAAAVALAALATMVWRQSQQVAALRDEAVTLRTAVDNVLGEVTRMRIEQSATGKGPQALLEKLRVYAPLAATSRTAEPDYQNALKSMDEVILAFRSLGADAWKPIADRLLQLRPDQHHDEIKQLLRAALAVDPKQGVELLEQVLLGYQHPSPKLRWFAAGTLIEHDKPRAQRLLRRILQTESHRGIDTDRLAVYGAPIPDLNAMAGNGFSNFVNWYVKSGDEQMEETLLQLLGRTMHDTVTIQECIKALAERKCARAVPMLEKLYSEPPLQQDNAIFDTTCLRGLIEIRGKEARPFLEQALLKARSETVTRFLQEQLKTL